MRYKLGIANTKQALEELNAIEKAYRQQNIAEKDFNRIINLIGKTVEVQLTDLTIKATVVSAIKTANGFYADVIGCNDNTAYRVKTNAIKEANYGT